MDVDPSSGLARACPFFLSKCTEKGIFLLKITEKRGKTDLAPGEVQVAMSLITVGALVAVFASNLSEAAEQSQATGRIVCGERERERERE